MKINGISDETVYNYMGEYEIIITNVPYRKEGKW